MLCEKKPHSDSITDHSSHANYRYLSSEELKTRLVNVQKEKRASEKRIMKLREKLKLEIEENWKWMILMT